MTDLRDLSVVIPVWDAYVCFLDSCLADLRSQGEIGHVIIVDNASSQTIDVQDATILRSESRLTVGAARNLALPYVNSALVTFHDVDDLLSPGVLGRLAHELRTDRRLDAAMARAVKLNEAGQQWLRTIPRAAFWLERRRHVFALLNAFNNVLMTNGGTILRTDSVRAAGGFGNTNFGEDWELATVIAARGYVAILDIPGLIWRIHDASLWHRRQGVRELWGAHRTAVRRVLRDPLVPRGLKFVMPLTHVAAFVRFLRLALKSGSLIYVNPDVSPPNP